MAFVCVCVASVLSGCLTWSTVADALADGRHYEMVSPPYKAGYGVNKLEAVAMAGAHEGDRVIWWSLGSFAGEPNGFAVNTYVSQRGEAGWATGPLMLPASLAEGNFVDVAPMLELGLFLGQTGPNNGAAEFENREPEFFVHSLNAPPMNFDVAGFPLKRLDGKRFIFGSDAGASLDLCHVVFQAATIALEVQLLLPAAGPFGLYDLATGVQGCSEEPTLRLVGASNKRRSDGEPEALNRNCPTYLGATVLSQEGIQEGSQFNAVSADGSEMFFTTSANRSVSACEGEAFVPSNPAVLFVRLAGERTIEVSRPLVADCTSGPCTTAAQQQAIFRGASEAGTRAFFTTSQPLVTGDVDTGNDLYMANIGCPRGEPACDASQREVTSLAQVSHSSLPGESAEAEGEPTISPDGSRVYFVARGVLSEGANTEGMSPVKGADNLYVYDADTDAIHFIGDLCSGPGVSGPDGLVKDGAVADAHCPAGLAVGGSGGEGLRNDTGLWGGKWKEAQVAGQDGRFLLFATFARLAASDTNGARDIYRYDAEAERLDRVSVGEEGSDSNGNGAGMDAEIPPLAQLGVLRISQQLAGRAISEDGSRVVFETAEPLSPAATNGLTNAYEWHMEPNWSEGRVSLISSGGDEQSVREAAIDPTGKDVFFITIAGLLPQDTDGARDLYDSRLGDSFPPEISQAKPCAGDACQGPVTAPAPLPEPGSVSQAPGENHRLPIKAKKRNKGIKTKKRCKSGLTKRCHIKHARRVRGVGRTVASRRKQG